MTFIQYIHTNYLVPLYTLLWQVLFFIGGMGIVLIVNAVMDEQEWMCMGTLMGMIFGIFGVCTLLNGLNGNTRFHLAVSMGHTRKKILFYEAVLCVLTSGMSILVSWLGYWGEKTLYAALNPGFEPVIPWEFIFSWQGILLLISVTVVVNLFLSALLYRLGSRGFLTVWLLFFGGLSFLLRTIDISTWSAALPWQGWVAIGISVILLLLVWAVNTFRTAEVRF